MDKSCLCWSSLYRLYFLSVFSTQYDDCLGESGIKELWAFLKLGLLVFVQTAWISFCILVSLNSKLSILYFLLTEKLAQKKKASHLWIRNACDASLFFICRSDESVVCSSSDTLSWVMIIFLFLFFKRHSVGLNLGEVCPCHLLTSPETWWISLFFL